MTYERAAFERLVDVLDQVITKAGAIHSAPMEFGTGVALYKTEIHTIRAIGENPGVNVTKLAQHMGVTKGAVSQTANKLVRKGLVAKTRSPDDAKEVLLELTDLGWIGFHSHEQFHMDMLDTVRDFYGDDLKPRLDMIVSAMTDLNRMLDRFEQRREDN